MLRVPGVAGLALLGLGSLARGVTLDRSTALGGAWSWKVAEVAVFILGETPSVRRSSFGGAFLLSILLGWALRRWRGAIGPIAMLLVGADLALCGVMGDWANVAIHGVCLMMIVWSPALPAVRAGAAAHPAPRDGGDH